MTEYLRFSSREVVPPEAAVYQNQGIPKDHAVNANIEALLYAAVERFLELVEPAGLLSRISGTELAKVHYGEGLNEESDAASDVAKRAQIFSLFVVTLGERVCREIGQRFDDGDYALASMLDSVASAGADRAAALAENRMLAILRRDERDAPAASAMRYSPGYCGWHVSGQRKLFDFLRPERIGISLNESYLMQPLKSVSGVIIVGPQKIHRFPTTYPACSSCETHGCRLRIAALTTG